MVQRKVTNRLSIQPERLSLNHKSPSAHQENGKNGGGMMDLKKKKMKKSGSVKRPETDALRSPNFRRQVKRPTETVMTPNYMKGTSSSDARKEKGQVSVKTPQTNPDSSRLRRKSSSSEKLGAVSDKKAKGFARTTSLKLTSTRSFKPVRVTAKKCSSVALCEDMDVKRATCSSTLKDRKFPTYLALSPGGTELEGTSAMKVCPYTYCSLNGHRHAALPPLKSFLSAKRRMIKTQRSFKLGCLSPRRTKPANELDVSSPIGSPSTQEEVNDFFVEIYAPKEDDTAMDVPVAEGGDETGAGNHKAQEDQNDIMEQDTEAAQGFDTESEVSDTDWEMGHDNSAVYLDDEYSETEKESDAGGGKIESCLVEDGVDTLIQSDEFLANEVSQETVDEEGFASDSWSSSDGCESSGSCDNLETSMDVIDSATVNVPVEEEGLEAAPEYMHDSPLQGNQSSEADLPTENIGEKVLLSTLTTDDVPDQTSEDDEFQVHDAENQDHHQDGGEIHNTSLTRPAKESRSAVPETEDSSLTIVLGKGKKLTEDTDELGQFNPRDPNFLPVQPEPEGENVDLKHQELDERKNAEEWMVDFALRQVVTKLGPARKRKVALLVEAFERVIPMTKCEFHQTYSPVFESPRPMQACI